MLTVATREVGLAEHHIGIGYWIMFNSTGILAKKSMLMDHLSRKGSKRVQDPPPNNMNREDRFS
jgi:hypothetical protein